MLSFHWHGDLESEVVIQEFGFLGNDHRSLDSVLQFANVARPWLLLQKVHGVGRDPRDALVHLLRELVNEVIDQGGDVVLALAQRRQLDAKDIQAIEEVGTKFSFLDQTLQDLCWSRPRSGNRL